ncbi:MAG: S1 RNA-binding domain-containing protein [Chitinispirillaceae bacterium]|jgi:small subunit ribosomal protein S1|nr:S1 RNA-binding domain-containing protein [Chitinispirillaceae bacterium]
MLDKKDDTFFDDDIAGDDESAKLLAMIDAGKKTIRSEINAGDKVTGVVSRIGKEYVFVDIGGKNEAMIATRELAGPKGLTPVAIGDTITAFVVSASMSETILSRSMGGGKGQDGAGMQNLFDALNNQVPVQGRVSGVNKGGVNVTVLGHKAFCPAGQLDIRFTPDLNAFLGKSMDFMVTRITEGGRNIVLSRIPLLEEELGRTIDSLSGSVKTHTPLRGTITRIAEFGLFVDIGGCEGLVHISEVSWERAADLGGTFSAGQQVECIVLGIEKKTPLRMSKISLSIKQVLDNPWTTVKSRFSIGQTVPGTVIKLMPFGAFVEIAPGIEGLVHVSEMSWVRRIRHPSEILSEGQPVEVSVLSIDDAKKTLSLSLKNMDSDPWRDAAAKYHVGAMVDGVVAKRMNFGFFVDLADGVTGLLPNANIAPDRKNAVTEKAKLSVRVESIDTAARRISLSLGMQESFQEAAEVKEFLAKQTAPKLPESSGRASDFGSALHDALKKKFNK